MAMGRSDRSGDARRTNTYLQEGAERKAGRQTRSVGIAEGPESEGWRSLMSGGRGHARIDLGTPSKHSLSLGVIRSGAITKRHLDTSGYGALSLGRARFQGG